jgi:flagellar hook-associated protein 3 FlgL
VITRITQRSLATTSLDGLQANLGRMQRLQEKLSSGKEIARPSDDPSGAAGAMQIRTDQARTAQYDRNADDGMAWLGTADSALQQVNGNLMRVRDLALTGVNASLSPTDREALALEVDSLRAGILTSANTSYLGRPVFGGTTPGTTAYDTSGTWVGNDVSVRRNVAPGVQVDVSMSGQTAFGPAGDDVLAVVDRVAAMLRGDTSQLQAGITDLDARMSGVREAMATVGARYNRVQDVQSTGTERATSLTTRLSELEGVDLPATIMELKLQETAYQAALSATGRVLQPSLMDYLR